MNKLEKSTPCKSIPMGGIMMSSTSEVTIFPKDAPMITPTARSITLPRIANSLNSLNISTSPRFRSCAESEAGRPARFAERGEGASVTGHYIRRNRKNQKGTAERKALNLTRSKNENRPQQAAHQQQSAANRE